VNLGKTPSSEFVQCVLWVVRLTRLLSRSAVLFATLDAGRHQPSAARPTTPAVRSVSVVYYAVVTTRLLLSACC